MKAPNFITGDLCELTATVMCPIYAEEAAHEGVVINATIHVIGSVTIYSGDVVKLVRPADARHALFRLAGMLVCLSTKNLKLSEVKLS